MGRLAGYLLAVPGFFLHLPVILLVLTWDKSVLKDQHLVPAARWVAGMFLVPLWYLVAVVLAHGLAGSLMMDAALLAAMPFSLWVWSRS